MRIVVPAIAVLLLTGAWSADDPRSEMGLDQQGQCLATAFNPDPPEYYRIDLVTTKKVSGSRLARGFGDVTYAPSPFGVSISNSGTYVYDLNIGIDNIKAPEDGVFAVWVTTPDLKQVELLGTLDEDFRLKGRVAWNKFLVVVSHETQPLGDRWRGAIALRGMSRSGMMHTMAGHGPFQTEPCAVYGYS